MSEIVLKTIVEKLEALENAIKELKEKINGVTDYSADFKKLQGDYREIKMTIASIPSQISIPVDEIRECNNGMAALMIQLKQPIKHQVRNIYYPGKPMLVFGILVVVIFGLFLLLFHEMDIVSREKKNDLKYRAITVSSDTSRREAVHYIDSFYYQNPEQLKKIVEQVEMQRDEYIDADLRSSAKNTEEKIKPHKIKPSKKR